MKPAEYILSVIVAVVLLAALGVLSGAGHSSGSTALSCRSGQVSAPVLLKGMSLYRCPGGKRG